MAIPLGRAAAETGRHEVAEAHASFELFFDQTHQLLFGGLCLVTGNRHEAEEIMQDAYLKVWGAMGARERHGRPHGLLVPNRHERLPQPIPTCIPGDPATDGPCAERRRPRDGGGP